MIDLYLLCTDLKNKQSRFSLQTTFMISRIYSYLNCPSGKTEKIIAGWKEDFRYIYGDISTNLSSNSKLKKEELLTSYGITAPPGKDETEGLQLLFFSIQTYFSLLIKYILENILQSIHNENVFSYEEMIIFTEMNLWKNYVIWFLKINKGAPE